MKKVLVTGADGFIGSHLTESLLEKGYDVKAFTYYNSFNTWGWLDTLPKEKLDQIEVFSGDVRDPNGVREAMKGVDQVFHLAALIAIPFSYHSPDSYVDTNIKGTSNILQAARDLGTALMAASKIPVWPTISGFAKLMTITSYFSERIAAHNLSQTSGALISGCKS